jgi:putative ABC transport system permease protein
MGESYLGQVFADIVGDPPPAAGARPIADYQIISPSYLATVDLPLIEGRAFDDRDRDGSTPVCLVNEAFVRRVLGERPAIGARVALRSTEAADAPPQLREIVGVVRQVKGRADETDEFLQVYVPLAQNTVGDIFLVVRPESGDGRALAPAVRRAFATIDKDQLTSVREMVTLEDVAAEGTARHRFRALLVVTFGTLALVLAMIGVFGVLAYSVEQRVRDFGVRRALGATTGDVLRVVARSAGVMIGIGTLVGLALSAGAGRLLASLLFGVEPLDLPTFAAVAATLAATAVAASLAPAWRAARIDPVLALRAD